MSLVSVGLGTAPRFAALASSEDWDELERLATEANAVLDGMSAVDMLRWARSLFGDRLVIASSMSELTLVHLASEVIPGVDVMFLDTGYHFPETLATRDRVSSEYSVNVRTISSGLSLREQEVLHGEQLFARDPDLCCGLRKVEPLDRDLTRYRAWMSGLRRDESADRANTPLISWDRKRRVLKICPLAAWAEDDVRQYESANGVIVNPLKLDGYPSIGCAPCTRRTMSGEDSRAGRWAGFAKTECGIHH